MVIFKKRFLHKLWIAFVILAAIGFLFGQIAIYLAY